MGKISVPSIPFHGDQLFEERARNVIGTFKDGDNEFDRLEGLHPEFADWRAKVNVYEVNGSKVFMGAIAIPIATNI